MIMPRNVPDIAVIGAGMAGLACAERLAERGLQVEVFDAGRNPGGRVALRQRHGYRFEHGAPGYQDTMHTLARRVPVASGCRITALERTDEGRWRLYSDGHPLRSLHAEVVLAVPPAQAMTLLDAAPHLRESLASVQMRPVLTALVGLAVPLGRGFDHIEFNDISLAEARRQIDDETAGPESWVLHGSAAFSRDNVECDPGGIADHLWRRFQACLSATIPSPLYLRGHRWRYGRTELPLGRDCLHDPELGLGLCGDWCLGDGVEHAMSSGRALAARVLGIPERPVRVEPAAKEERA